MTREFLTLPEVANMIGCTRRFLETRIHDGELKVFRPSSRIVRVRRMELERWIEQFSYGGTHESRKVAVDRKEI
jgi:excisionase family DNA binding protein